MEGDAPPEPKTIAQASLPVIILNSNRRDARPTKNPAPLSAFQLCSLLTFKTPPRFQCRRERKTPLLYGASGSHVLRPLASWRLRTRHSTKITPNENNAQVDGSGITVKVPVD